MDQENRTIVLTGFTAGIGRATAFELARRGARLALVCRNPEKGADTAREIRTETGNDRLQVFHCDLSSMSATRRLAGELLESCERIDVLLNNAGIFAPKRRLTSEGLETTFATNHMSYYLLTRLLLERVIASGGRVVNVASTAHKNATLDLDDLQNEKNYSGFRVYCESKLANIYFTFELARRLAGSGATANCLHPGVIGTELIRPWGRFVAWAWKLFTATPAEGAETSVYLATAPELAGVSGKYFDDKKEARVSAAARDADTARRLWDISANLCGLPPEL